MIDPLKVIVNLALGFFAVFSIVTATQLGVFTDEVYFATPAMRLALGMPYYQHAAFAGTISFFGPPAIGQYVYAFPLTYLLAATFGVFGVTPGVLRAFYSLVQLAAGVATYLGAKKTLGKRPAQVAFILFLIHPSLYAVTRDSPDSIFQVLLLQLGFIAMLYDRPFLAGLLLGAGVNTKISLLPPALVLSAVFFGLYAYKRSHWLGLMVLGSILGSIEALISNFFEPLLQLGASFVQKELVELGNGMSERILRTARSAFSFFSGGSFDFSDVRQENYLNIPLIAASAAGLLLAKPPENHKACKLFCFTMIASYVLLSLTPSKIEPRHFAYLFPFACTIVGAAFVYFAARWRSAVICAAGIAVACVWDLSNSISYIVALERTGGTGLHSRKVNELATGLLLRKPNKVVLLDWGLKDSLDFLAQGKLPLVDNFEAQREIDSLVSESGNLYVTLPRFRSRYSIESLFGERLAKSGRGLTDELVVDDQNGVLFAVKRVVVQTEHSGN